MTQKDVMFCKMQENLLFIKCMQVAIDTNLFRSKLCTYHAAMMREI